jgi:riboflavin synthase
VPPAIIITVNGVSLTVNRIEENDFDINIVPHTLSVTTLGQLTVGDAVNLEVDIIARHLEQLIKNK